jgi:hypothetical protein
MLSIGLAAMLLVQPGAGSGKQAKPAAVPATPPTVLGVPAPTGPLVAFPHPLVTEVYYAVASGPGGDANGDGSRDANGDEFVEIVNPHDKPINLKGYTISGKGAHAIAPGEMHDHAQPDSSSRNTGKSTGNNKPSTNKPNASGSGRSKGDYRQVTFTFPDCELEPGQVAVVFNGHEQRWEGQVGDKSRAPQKGQEKFHGALVFTMGVSADNVGFANKGDYVLLTGPDGTPIECVKWGEITEPANHGLLDEAPLVTGQSVQRRTLTGAFQAHPVVNGVKFSPGLAPSGDVASETKPVPSNIAKPTKGTKPKAGN